VTAFWKSYVAREAAREEREAARDQGRADRIDALMKRLDDASAQRETLHASMLAQSRADAIALTTALTENATANREIAECLREVTPLLTELATRRVNGRLP